MTLIFAFIPQFIGTCGSCCFSSSWPPFSFHSLNFLLLLLLTGAILLFLDFSNVLFLFFSYCYVVARPPIPTCFQIVVYILSLPSLKFPALHLPWGAPTRVVNIFLVVELLTWVFFISMSVFHCSFFSYEFPLICRSFTLSMPVCRWLVSNGIQPSVLNVSSSFIFRYAFVSNYWILMPFASFHSTTFCSNLLWIHPYRVANSSSSSILEVNNNRMNLSWSAPWSRMPSGMTLAITIIGTFFSLVNTLPYLVSNLHCCPSSTRNKVLSLDLSVLPKYSSSPEENSSNTQQNSCGHPWSHFF